MKVTLTVLNFTLKSTFISEILKKIKISFFYSWNLKLKTKVAC